jgi:hypothetical protein
MPSFCVIADLQDCHHLSIVVAMRETDALIDIGGGIDKSQNKDEQSALRMATYWLSRSRNDFTAKKPFSHGMAVPVKAKPSQTTSWSLVDEW